MSLRRRFLDLDGAVVVVTGASSGIGRATALELADRGACLVLAGRGEDALDEALSECHRQGARAIAVSTDVSDPDGVAALAGAAERQYGRIDAWINNAGVMAYGRFDEVPIDAHVQVVRTNLLGSMYGAHEALQRFRRQGGGVLVNVASLYAEMTTPFVSSYVTSKFGLLGFSRVLQRDLKPAHGIAVCCVLPASIDTPIFRHAANYFGRGARAIPPVAAPGRVARAIVGCLEHPERELRVGWTGRVLSWGEKLLPPVYDRVVNAAMRVAGFTSEEHPPDPGNVFEPTEAWTQIDGEWRNSGARRAALGLAGVAAAGVIVARSR